jgi:hypothetical protein
MVWVFDVVSVCESIDVLVAHFLCNQYHYHFSVVALDTRALQLSESRSSSFDGLQHAHICHFLDQTEEGIITASTHDQAQCDRHHFLDSRDIAEVWHLTNRHRKVSTPSSRAKINTGSQNCWGRVIQVSGKAIALNQFAFTVAG